MKILMISSYLPYPLHSGGQVRLYNLIKELSDKHEITLICEKRNHQTEKDITEVENICKKVITVNRRKQWTLKNITKSAFSSQSFLTTGHLHKKMQKAIKDELLKEKFDLIHVETYYVMQNVPVTSLPIVLVDHNIEYKVYQRFVNRTPFAMRPLLSLDIAKIRREEEDSWRSATKVVAVSQEDAKVMEKTGVSPLVVSNGVNISLFKFKKKTWDKADIKNTLFIGDFKWLQNRDSVEFILKEVWPEIMANEKWKMENGNLKLWIVGRHIPDSIRALTSDPNVLFDTESSSKSAEQ